MRDMNLDQRLEELARGSGVDFFGVADLSSAREAIEEQGGEVVASYPRAISLGIALLHEIVDQLPQRSSRAVAMNYRHHAYDVVNQRLDHIASHLSGTVQAEGYRALPIPASQTVDQERLVGVFSHKLAAHLAGLGWIGKSCLLVTREAGPRVRWATVLTDAPLVATGEPIDERCGKCRECVEVCPPHAFSGEPFRQGEPREVRFDVHKCRSYLDQAKESIGVSVCGLCLYVCPHGREIKPQR